MTEAARYCLYFTAPPGGALDRLGSAVIGYDAYAGRSVPSPPLPGADAALQDELTREPRRYGFHATLKAPFRLRDGDMRERLLRELHDFAGGARAVPIGGLIVRALGPFLAFVPAAPNRELDLLAAEITAAFDAFRAPLRDEERARRLAGGLTRRQTSLLDRWGYPHVFEEFRFHMTLTGSLPEGLRERWLEALQDLARDIGPVTVDAVSLLEQADPSSRFRVVERVPLGG